MQDIRLVGNDGEYLTLETQSGDKFRLILDDSIREAVKCNPTVKLDNISIKPRAIQDAVRAGATSVEVATEYDVPLDYVQKFAQTVVDEIGHIIASAQAVRVTVAADRYSEATQFQFSQLVNERIQSLGGSNTQWSACKYEGLPWQVTVSFLKDAETVSATWAFDQRKLILSPENEAALKFSNGNQVDSFSTPKLHPISPLHTEIQPSNSESGNSDNEIAVVKIPFISVEVTEPMEVAEGRTETKFSATVDLLEALRKKRDGDINNDSSGSSGSTAPENAPDPLKNDGEVILPDVFEANELESAPEPMQPPIIKKGRPSMPSWDEIVFGTKADD